MKPQISELECKQFISESQSIEIKDMRKNIITIKDEMYQLQNKMIGYQDEIKNIENAVIYCRRDIEETSNKHIPNHIRGNF